jgi:PAS domain S-box-containing protein
MSGDLQEQIQAMQQRVTQLQRQMSESSSPQQQELMTAGLQELSTALQQLQVANTARQQQQLEQQQVSERLQLALGALDCIIYDWDVETRTVDRTFGLLQVLGYHPHEAEPTLEWWTERIHPDDREQVRQIVYNALTNSTTFAVEYRIRDKSDRYRYIWDKGQIIRNALGKAIRVVGSTIDISDRKQTEQALQQLNEELEQRVRRRTESLQQLNQQLQNEIAEHQQTLNALRLSEQRLSELATNIPGAIYQFVQHADGSYSFPYMSPGSHRVFEIEASEIENNSAIVINLIHPSDRQSFEDSVTTSAETLDAWHWEGRLILPSGELKWLRGASCPKKQANGDVLWDGLLMDITTCKNFELALQESELRFRQLADNISQVFWVATPDLSQMLYVSPACENVWGCSQASVYEQPDSWLDAIHPDDREQIATVLKNQRDEPQTGEYRVVHPDGSVRWVRFYRFPIRNEAGDIYRIVGIAEDFSERKQVEETIRQREQEFRAVVENAPDIITRFDSQLRHLYVNPALEQATGISRETFIGKTNRELGMPEPNILLWEPVIQRIFETGTEDRCEFSYITPNGLRYYQARYVPEFTADGTVQSVLEISRDITELKQAEETIRRREQEFRALVENAPDVIARFDRQLRHVYLNPAAEGVTGIPSSEFIGKTNRELNLPEPNLSNWEQIIQRIFETGLEDVFEFSFVTPTGLRYYQGRYVPEFAADGTVEFVLGICRDISELKQAEDALADSEQRFRTCVETMLDCFGIYTSIRDKLGTIVDFRFEYVNTAACDNNRMSKEEQIGKSLCELLPNHRESGLLDEYVQVVETGQPLIKEDLIYEDVFGGVRLSRAFDIRAVKLNDGFAVAWRDITQRKQAEDALRYSEERLRSLIENMPVMLDAWDENANLIAWNGECERVTGYSAAEIIGNPRAVEMLYPDAEYLARMMSEWQELGYDYRDWEWMLTSKDGQLKTIAWYNISQEFPIQGWHGWAIGVDVTERKRAEDALRESEQRFRQLAENIREVFWLASPDRNQRIYISSAYEEIWGRTCQSWYEEPLSLLEVIHPDDRDRVVAALETMKLEEHDHEYRIVRSDGTIRWIRDRSFPVRDAQGRVYRIAGIAEDITSRKLAEAEIAQALQQERELGELKSNFIAIASHQFRTPLTTIASSAELLERYRDRFSQEKQLTHLSRIQTGVKQMTQLLDDVLLVGKAGAGKLEFNPTRIDVVQFCQELVEELQLSNKHQHAIAFAHHGNCTKAVEGTTDLLPLLDEKYLRHIFDNLLTNAIKYSPNKGTVRFELTCSSDRAVFHVQDEGIGIPQEDLPHLFESFHRARNVGSIQGTGLGLAIVKQCVELHGGEILVESEVGSGTRFTVILPLNYLHSF